MTNFVCQKVRECVCRKGKRLFISKAHNPPPTLLQCNRGDQIFLSLCRGGVTCPIHLDHYLVPREEKVHHSPESGEWVLGAIRLPKAGYEALKSYLGPCLIGVEPEPIPKESHTNEDLKEA